MSEQKQDSLQGSYSVGQLAKRWGVSAERVKHLVESGKLPGSFTIPSAGRYGKAVRIPAKAVRHAEQAWASAPTSSPPKPKPKPKPKRSACGHVSTFKHFPEFTGQDDGGSL